jgi:uncharacterized protein YjbI with pentapeptide repeats
MDLQGFWQLMNMNVNDFRDFTVNGIDFARMLLKDLDFSNADIRNANFYKSTFENCIFNETNISNTNITECDFENCIFNGANLSNCEVQCSGFMDSQFVCSNFTELWSDDIAFSRCDLRESKFTNAIVGGYFYSSDLSRSQWQRAYLSRSSFIECNLIQVNMNDMRADEVIIIDSIYPNGTIGDLDWYNIEVKGEPPIPEPPITIHSRDRVELKSETGTDYSKLRDLLSECRWKAAQHKTHELIANLQGEGVYYLNPEALADIPCTDLVTIDRLWFEYSWGQFGFSIQKEIWISIYEGYDCNSKRYDTFLKHIWMRNFINTEKSNDEKSIKLVPSGYYPNFVNFFLTSEDEIGLAALYRRLSECEV